MVTLRGIVPVIEKNNYALRLFVCKQLFQNNRIWITELKQIHLGK